MMKRIIDNSLTNVQFDEKNKAAVRKKIERQTHQSHYKANVFRRLNRRMLIPVAACICVFLFTSVSVALELPQKIIGLFEPVNTSSVYDGIELNIIEAAADQDSMMILFSLRDTIADRITENTGIEEFHLSNVSTLGLVPHHFDTETRTAYFYLIGENGYDMKENKVTLSIDSLTYDSELHDYPTQISLAQLTQNDSLELFTENSKDPERIRWNAQSTSGSKLREEINLQDIPILKPDTLSIPYPDLPWITITGAGFADGWLHIQIQYAPEKNEDDHGYLYIADSQGNDLGYPVLNQSFDHGYEEYIIRLEEDVPLESLFLAARYTNLSDPITGTWNSTFKIEGVETMEWKCDLNTGALNIRRIALSPLGITIYGTGDFPESVSIKRSDQTIVETGSSSGNNNESYKYRFDETEELTDIVSILINGTEIVVPFD